MQVSSQEAQPPAQLELPGGRAKILLPSPARHLAFPCLQKAAPGQATVPQNLEAAHL